MIWTKKKAATRDALAVGRWPLAGLKFIVHRSSFIVFLLLALACRSEQPARTIKDDVGRDVAVPSKVTRLITLAPNLTEIVYAIGAEAALIATDDNSDFPSAAQRLPKVGAMQPDVEKITALKPDLVIASTEGNQPSLAPALAAVNIPLFVVKTDRLSEIGPAMARLGGIIGSARAAESAKELERRIDGQRRTRAKSPRVLFAVWADPLYVGGQATFIDDVLRVTGGTNAVTVSGWPQYPLESLIAAPPDIIIYPGKAVPRDALERLFQARPELLRSVELIAVDDNLFTRPGPRVSEAAQALNGLLDRWAASH
jgi:iron complex transport system substrate-binding protein